MVVGGGLETRKRGVGAGEIRSRITVKRSSHDVMGFGDAREAVAAKRHLARTHPDQAASAKQSKHRTTMKRYCDTRQIVYYREACDQWILKYSYGYIRSGIADAVQHVPSR